MHDSFMSWKRVVRVVPDNAKIRRLLVAWRLGKPSSLAPQRIWRTVARLRTAAIRSRRSRRLIRRRCTRDRFDPSYIGLTVFRIGVPRLDQCLTARLFTYGVRLAALPAS